MSKIPHGTIPYINNQNSIPEPIDPGSDEGKRLKREERRKRRESIDIKRVSSIVPRVKTPENHMHLIPFSDTFKIFPDGWWKCNYLGCPVGFHGVGEPRCPVLASLGRPFENGEVEGARDPIGNKEGWLQFCPLKICRKRTALDEAHSKCYCGEEILRDAVIKSIEESCPEPSSEANFIAVLKNLQEPKDKGKEIETTPEEEIDVLEGGYEDERFELSTEVETKSEPKKSLSLKLPLDWMIVYEDKPSSSK